MKFEIKYTFLIFLSTLFLIPIEVINGVNPYETPYKLNVIYFLPKGGKPIPEYERRLSEMLRYVQNFYGSEMERNEYGYKTFGLSCKGDGYVDIIIVKGERDSSFYSNVGPGGSNARGEIETYFKKNPQSKKSEHTLVFMAKTKEHHSGGVPYYALGRYAFIMDYEGYDLKHLGEGSEYGILLPTYLGGLGHELGHGLNLPHNKETVSESKTLGTTLMGRGNYTLGESPTFLTGADCAILNNCQLFSPDKKDFYTDEKELLWKDLTFDFDSDGITIKGEFDSEKAINAVIAYFDPAPYGSNRDYDAQSFLGKLQNDSFNLVIPYNELYQAEAEQYQIRLRLLHLDGTFSETSRVFNRPFPEPYKLEYKKELPKTGWKVRTSDSQRENSGDLLIDGKYSTFWHSKWTPVKIDYPHWVEVTFPKDLEVKGISLCQRKSLHGVLREITIQTKGMDGKWSNPQKHELDYHNAPQYIDLEEKTKIRGVRINAVTTYTEDDPKIAVLAEIGVY